MKMARFAVGVPNEISWTDTGQHASHVLSKSQHLCYQTINRKLKYHTDVHIRMSIIIIVVIADSDPRTIFGREFPCCREWPRLQ